MFWAMAKMAPLSFAVATVSPVLIAFSVAARLPWVLLRYSNAVMASVFVLTLSMYASVLVRIRCALGAFCPTQRMASRVPEALHESLGIVLQGVVRIIFLANSCRDETEAGISCRARQFFPTWPGNFCRAVRIQACFLALFTMRDETSATMLSA